jgi:hypothetical protein
VADAPPLSLGALQEEGAIWIEYMDIRQLMPDPENPKDHDIGALTESTRRPEHSSTATVAGRPS